MIWRLRRLLSTPGIIVRDKAIERLKAKNHVLAMRIWQLERSDEGRR